MAKTRRIAIASEYQQTREQRIKQNRDRFQKLGIVDLCLKLKPKRTPKPFKSPSLGPTQPSRRSSRLQNPPPVSKRSRDIVLEEGANPEFYTAEHDGLQNLPPVPKRSRDIVLEEGTKPAEDPNKPKRPLSAFFVFMEDFRVQYQQIHPDNKSVAAAGKAGGVKWRSMSDAEKVPYVEEVEKRKADYERIMSAYKKRLDEGSQDEREDEADKSKSEVNDEDVEYNSGKVCKAGGEKWRSMSDAETAPYIEKVEERKAELQNGPPVSLVKPKEDKTKSRDIMLEEGAKPEFDIEEHDKLLGTTEIPSIFSVNRLSVKKGAAKKGRTAKHLKKPKRPPGAFFVFMEDFRVQYKQKHPDNKSIATFAKAAGEKWKSMSDAEKAPYVEEVEKRKADYEKNMSAYKKRRAEGSQDEREDESDKSGSEVNDVDDDDDSGMVECPQDERKDELDKSRSEVNDEDDYDDSGKAEGSKDEREDESDKSGSEVNDEDDDDDSGKEKAPCIQKVEKRKADYEKNMSAYKKGLAEGHGGHHYQRHGWLPFPPPFLETNTAALEYEQIREQRIKQNHERFKELGIVDLSLQLKPRRTPKPSNHKIAPSLGPTQPRRQSFRLQNPPPVPKRSRDIVLEEGTKPAEDPNKPKRPLSAFFVFMEDFRVQYQQKHPDNKSVAAAGKAGGVKWRSMSDAEKVPYVEEVEKRKADYERIMSAYKKRLAEGSQDEREDEADKSTSEVNDEDVDYNSGKVCKAGGEKWRSMSDAEKAPYVEEVEKRKADYEKNMSAYKKRRAEHSEDEREDESDKSGSEVNDVDDDDDSGKEVENDD
ncbi:uncharacterized protein LOC141586477 isoform X4 [Silene latifolia]|uniref:uncharacterized protein LOC141586477 isoform X4 n=1 Tax=Silene latifolia TaxID=37657 RepID=UPI003D7795F7